MAIIGNKSIKELIGVVISDKNSKSRVVLVRTVKLHKLYKKRFVVTKKYYVHDESNQTKEWDKVKIREVRPLSKTKRWMVIETI